MSLWNSVIVKLEKNQEKLVYQIWWTGFFVAKRGERMPRSPKKPCRHPGCPELVDGRGYCPEHTRLYNRNYEKYQRNPEIRKHYGHSWRKVRNHFIQQHPLCAHCLKNGEATLAQEVDHILPLSQGGTHDESNLQSLCKSCHSRKSAKEGSRWGRKKFSN